MAYFVEVFLTTDSQFVIRQIHFTHLHCCFLNMSDIYFRLYVSHVLHMLMMCFSL